MTAATAPLPLAAPKAKVTAIAPWFGSKRTLAPVIISTLGQHSSYWEPFCGSMAVLLVKEPVSMETVNDLNGDLVNLANVLRDESMATDMYGRLSRTLMHESVFRVNAASWKQRGRLSAPEIADVDRASEFFLCSWMGMNGVAGTDSYNQGFCARFTQNGGHAATRFVSAVESIPAWHHRLRHVTILSRDGIELCNRIGDDAGVAIYVDPPYLVKGAKYVHDFADADHQRLADSLSRFKKARVVVSYYDHPRLAALYPASSWQKIRCTMTKAMVNQGARVKGRTDAPEVLLVNQRVEVAAESGAGGLFA